ncbi:MAG: sel1 repeat family protein, partial [Bacteroidales bacterium]|nr:sel1 repeat family protein [Bacteroidales bacterium]
QCYYWDNRKREMHREAVKWYEKLAKRGEEVAMYRLGECFRDDSSGKRSRRKSFLWYKRAAERGHKEAMAELGFCYQKGIGIKRDFSIAAEWYEKAGMHDRANRVRNGEDEFAFDVFPSHPIPYMEEVDGLIPFPEMDMDNPF